MTFMKLFKNFRFTAVAILVISLILAAAAIPKNTPQFTLPLIGTVNLSPVTQTLSNINLQPLGIPFQKENDYQLGLDLQGGARLTYQVDMSEIADENREKAFESARDTIERRINVFGATEPKVQTQRTADSYRIIVEIPGATDVSQATDLIGQTAKLTFWEEGADEDRVASEEANLLPFGVFELYDGAAKETSLTGEHLESSSITTGQTGEVVVQIDFDSEGAKLFGDITRRNVGKPVAIVLDDVILSAPVVNEPITGGTAVISGGFTTDTAKTLSISLNSGALPAPLSLIEQQTIGPSLGAESLAASLVAAALGLAAVMIYMIAVYKKEGVLASVALITYTAIVLFIFKFFSITLTLAGIAGLVLSIGMAVDANILIFERMKEELRTGKSRSAAIQVGFQRAWTSIRDSNASSLITVFILYFLGTGIIRGFALALGIGIVVSMFSAIIVTRTLLKAFTK